MCGYITPETRPTTDEGRGSASGQAGQRDVRDPIITVLLLRYHGTIVFHHPFAFCNRFRNRPFERGPTTAEKQPLIDGRSRWDSMPTRRTSRETMGGSHPSVEVGGSKTTVKRRSKELLLGQPEPADLKWTTEVIALSLPSCRARPLSAYCYYPLCVCAKCLCPCRGT